MSSAWATNDKLFVCPLPPAKEYQFRIRSAIPLEFVLKGLPCTISWLASTTHDAPVLWAGPRWEDLRLVKGPPEYDMSATLPCYFGKMTICSFINCSRFISETWVYDFARST
jgi:hypothetical protein